MSSPTDETISALDQGTDNRVFISYAAADVKFAKAFRNLLRLGCDLGEEEVFFTARPGAIESGTEFVDAIREALHESSMAILLLTPSYYSSKFCLAEAGAVWVQQKVHVPILVPPVTYHDLEGVQLGTQASKVDSSSDLDALRDTVREVMGRNVSTGSWNEHKNSFLNSWSTELRDEIKPPDLVPAEEVDELQDKLHTNSRNLDDARSDIERLEIYSRDLASQNDELRSRVPEAPPKPLREGDEVAEQIADAEAAIRVAKEKVAGFTPLVREALFQYFHDQLPVSVGYNSNFDADDGRRDVERGYLQWDDDHELVVTVRHEQPQIAEAETALKRVRDSVFGGSWADGRSKAEEWIRPVLRDSYGIDDPTFQIRPVWESLDFL